MTRLTREDLLPLCPGLEEFEEQLRVKTGVSLRRLACQACGLEEALFSALTAPVRIAVVPVDWGLGIIEGFSEAVAAICRYLGLEAFVTRQANVAGLAEALERRADVLMTADDDRFVALELRGRRAVDNAEATGIGFAEALALMAGGLEGQRVLVIGCGPVGRAAALRLLALGASVCLCDRDSGRLSAAAREARRAASGAAPCGDYGDTAPCGDYGDTAPCGDTADRVAEAADLETALAGHHLILDASPAADIIAARHVGPGTIVSAPGVPHGLSAGALAAIGNRFLHDPLRIGVAVMAFGALKGLIP